MNKITKEKTQVQYIGGVYAFDVWLDESGQEASYEDLAPADDAECSEQEGVVETGFIRLA